MILNCDLWAGNISPNGYGRITAYGLNKYAHRIVYESEKGPIADNLTLDHLCRNKSCVNPEHLEEVTLTENLKRAQKDGKRTYKYNDNKCMKGHSLVNNMTIRGRCRFCQNKLNREYRLRKKGKLNVNIPTA